MYESFRWVLNPKYSSERTLVLWEVKQLLPTRIDIGDN